MTERFNMSGLKPFMVGLISSSLIWICYVCFISYGQMNCSPEPVNDFLSENAQLKSETETVKTVVQIMYKLTSDIGKSYRQKSYGRMKYGLRVILEDLSSALDQYSEEVASMAKSFTGHPLENPMLVGSSSMDVCPEHYSNRVKDYPLFRHGWKTKNCTGFKPTHKLLTFAVNFVGVSPHFILTRGYNMLRNISVKYPGITVMIASEETLPKKLELVDLNFVSLVLSQKESSEIIPNFVEACRTPYMFVAQNLTYFDGRDENLERLMRQISYTGVDIAGGSIRDKDGHWQMACQQITLEGFDLTFKPGYEFSQNSCVLCNAVDGPFVARTDWMRNFEFDIYLHEAVQVSDIFINRTLRMKPAFVCPDAMFYVDSNLQDLMHDRELMLPLAKKYELTSIHLADGTKHKFGSSEILDGCQNSRRQTLMRPGCCVDNLFNAVKRVLKICAKFGAQCEISEGTLLGAVKFGGILPWEKDADIIVRLTNTTLPEFGRALSNKEYKVQCRRGPESQCILHTKYWVVEVRLVEFLDSQELTDFHLARTKLRLGDIWAPAARNPGSNLRNRYGREIYRHADHWTVVGHTNSWQGYDSGAWVKCKFPGHRACLDRYRADGNMHFPLPVHKKPPKKKKKKKKKKVAEEENGETKKEDQNEGQNEGQQEEHHRGDHEEKKGDVEHDTERDAYMAKEREGERKWEPRNFDDDDEDDRVTKKRKMKSRRRKIKFG